MALDAARWEALEEDRLACDVAWALYVQQACGHPIPER